MFKKDNSNTDKRIPRFKYIVEMSNSFITEGARKILEDNGVILFTEASAIKGGVTSSSLEVMAAMSLSDGDFQKRMTPQLLDQVLVTPQFYKNYVEHICRVIDHNAQ